MLGWPDALASQSACGELMIDDAPCRAKRNQPNYAEHHPQRTPVQRIPDHAFPMNEHDQTCKQQEGNAHVEGASDDSKLEDEHVSTSLPAPVRWLGSLP